MLGRIATMLWGKFESKDELRKFGLLASIFGLIIGIYWALRPLKDSIFGAIVGMDYQPAAKWLSLLVIVPLVIVYGKLIDKFERHKVFYGLVSVYGLLALTFAALFMSDTLGLGNTVESPTRVIGWFWYVYVESFGSLIVALFWTFTTDITKPEAAKRGFPMIALLGQMGNIFGPLVLRANNFGFTNSSPIVAICGILTLGIGAAVWYFMKTTPQSELEGFKGEVQQKTASDKHEEPGFFEGLKMLFSHGYLMGIFLIIATYEVIITILDYHFKTSVKAEFPVEADMGSYLASYGVWTGIIATACVFFGINSIQRKLGMTASLVLLPILVASAVLTLKFSGGALAVSFWIMVLAKAINYALNQPTIKQLYIPTSKEAKYKSQAWIEMFGSRGSKAGGSAINMTRGMFKGKYGAAGVGVFLTLSTMASLGLVVGWLFVAMYVAKKYNEAIKQNKVVC